MKANLELRRLQTEKELKKELMQFEFNLNMQMKSKDQSLIDAKEKYKEDRKDERTKMQASQQSQLIDQRQGGGKPKNFESTGNDTMGSGFNLEQFEPR